MSVDVAQLEQHRTALTGHCYRMLGSVVDADDAVQETMVRAWRGLDGFDGRSSVKTWLYRIATNVCLSAMTSRSKRAFPILEGPSGTPNDTLEARDRSHWLEPIPDARAIPADMDPSEPIALRQSIRLAFVAALQHLSPKQRAALLLTEVLGFSATETAQGLDTSVASVNSAIQRARATLSERNLVEMPAALSAEQTACVDRFVEAFERYDVEALSHLLKTDATMSMPPYTLWLRGREAIGTWLRGRGAGCRGSRLVPTAACGSPAFAQYRQGGAEPWALVVLELSGDRISNMTYFLDTETLFPLFGMPRVLREARAERAQELKMM